ncbi:MAG: ATP-binding cassette domain-containing protein [Bacteroidetes bacterium]|nr:ATP-binding cassette domain-containing protein [Bacteroidota bacterium]
MDIASIDYWANSGTSPLHRGSALAKGIAALAFVAAVVVTSSPYLLATLYLLLLVGVFASRLPARKLMMIAAYPTLFALLFAASQWNGNFAGPITILLKALTAAQAMVLLITTTPYPDIFAGVGRLMPGLLADGLFLTYRSFFLLLSEMGRVLTALRLRGGLRKGRYLSNAANLARALGMLLVRAIDLSERLYGVLRVRGYRGRLEPGPRWRTVSRADAMPLAYGAAALVLASVVRVLPGLWGSVNGFALGAAALMAVASYFRSRQAVTPAELTNQHPAPGTQHPELGSQHPELGTQNPEPRTQNSELSTQHPTPSTQHSELGTPHPAPGSDVARVSCVRHVYPDGTQVSLCGLDFVAHRGERVVILGPNGAGKSTLLNHILGLLRPTEGEVVVLGHDPAREFAAIQPKLGVLLQDVDDQLLGPTVADDVAFGARNAGFGEASVEMARRSMERLNILHLADKVPHYLSGGEKRKVALAGALVTDPELLVLDEPFEGLDPRSRNELVALLMELHRERNLTMIVTTHHVDMLPTLADTVYVLADGGRIVAKGSPEEVFARSELLKESSIEPPALTLLFQRLKEEGVDLGSPADLEDAVRRILEIRLETVESVG